jgi:sugar-phosphatase
MPSPRRRDSDRGDRAHLLLARHPRYPVAREMVSFRCRAILFDLDGVLVDSAECVEHTLRLWAPTKGLDAETIIPIAHGRRTIDTIRTIGPHLDADREVAALEAIESTTTRGVHEVAGARELLAALPPRSWAIVTSGSRAVATLRIRHVGLPFPDVLVCAGDVTQGKPDPEGYLAAARALGRAPKECVVIEDAPAGVAAARAAGMRSIAIATTHPRDTLADADAIVTRLADLQLSRIGETGELHIVSTTSTPS